MKRLETDVLIVGGGTGGCAAALALLEAGYRVVMTEETDWIGGQLTSQMVPPDEHWGIERYACTLRYRNFREGVRQYYREHYPLSPEARCDSRLNPGGGSVSRLCFEPRVGVEVLNQAFIPYKLSGRLQVLLNYRPIAAETQADRIQKVHFQNCQVGKDIEIAAQYFLDATELGDILPLAKVEYISGSESQAETGELHALAEANPEDVQSFTWCLPLAFDPACEQGSDKYLIPKPKNYETWRDLVPEVDSGWPGPLFSWCHPHPVTLKPFHRTLFPPTHENGSRPLWIYRQIVTNKHYPPHLNVHEATIVNWPQNDYFFGNIIDKSSEETARLLQESRDLSLSFVYWLQNDAPRPDGGTGYAGLYLRPDLSGTHDGLAKAPYIREARRIRGLFTVTENHIGREARGCNSAERFWDSVGTGYYRIDLHPSPAGRNYLDIESLPFQIPMGSLIPRRVSNLLAAGKNVSVTHIANGCYRLHPVEWNIGEAAGALAAFCLANKRSPASVHACKELVEEFQNGLMAQGVETEWPRVD